jgi:hypothetical protein
VSAAQSRQRSTALTGQVRVTRRAQLAAYHAIFEPPREA